MDNQLAGSGEFPVSFVLPEGASWTGNDAAGACIDGDGVRTARFLRAFRCAERGGAIVPLLAFAVASGVVQEPVYGLAPGLTGRVVGPWLASVGQAVVFGLAHGGPGLAASPIPLVLAMTAGGLVAGLVV